MYEATSSVHHITHGAGGYTFVVTKRNLPDTGTTMQLGNTLMFRLINVDLSSCVEPMGRESSSNVRFWR